MLFVWVEGCCQPLFSRFPSSAETSNWRTLGGKSNNVGFGGQNLPSKRDKYILEDKWSNWRTKYQMEDTCKLLS